MDTVLGINDPGKPEEKCQCAFTLIPGNMVRLKGDPKDLIHADCGKRLQYYRSEDDQEE